MRVVGIFMALNSKLYDVESTSSNG